MIEMLQQPKIQAGNTPKITTHSDQVETDSQPSSKSDASFDKHLNEQIQRTPAKEQQPVTSKKTVENQSTDEVSLDDAPEESLQAESVESGQSTDESGQGTDTDALQLVTTDIIDTVIDDGSIQAESQPEIIEQSLPPDGNELPPVAVAGLVSQPETTEQAQEPIKVNVSQQAAKSINETNPAQQQGSVAVAKQVISQEQATAQTQVSEEAVDFDMPEMKMQTAQQNGATQTAGGKLNALFASVAAAASMNQQVPVTTSISPLYTQAAQLPTADSGFFSLQGFSAGIHAPVQQHGAWAQGLTDQMALMVQGKLQTAEIKLNPAHLGPMEIKLSMHDDKASVTFVTQHAAVREALDVAMPRLREMFESQGLNLANVDVSQYSDQNGKPSDQLAEGKANGGFGLDAAGNEQGSVAHESIIHVNGHSGLSLYA